MNSPNYTQDQYKLMANAIRALTMDAVEKASSGHPGMPMGMADVATVLYSKFMKFSPKHPEWLNRDRLVLSAGHGSMLLYSLLYLTGYEAISIEDIKNFRQLGSKTAGHPEYGHLAGIETTTGPLGQGLANAVGFAIAEAKLAQKFPDLIDHHTYVIAGDGCLMEGISHEAISLAGKLKLSKLIVLFDDNNISIDGKLDLTCADDQLARFTASGWHVQEINGHDHAAIEQALKSAKESDKPSLIACKTIIAFGAPIKAGTAASHGAPLGANEVLEAKKALDWEYAEFEIPAEIKILWEKVGQDASDIYEKWRIKPGIRQLESYFSKKLPDNLADNITKLKHNFAKSEPAEATRASSGKVLEAICAHDDLLIGGSADLSSSNNTKTTYHKVISYDNYDGNYIHYGVREHAMAAIMNGLALYGPFIPYGGTFLVFADYMRPAIRLSAIMQQRVIYVMTHDSIGVGEDGPTHQPVEHLSSLRAIPGLRVIRPADASEVAEAWELALKASGPTIISLTRQKVGQIRNSYIERNMVAEGAYFVKRDKESDICIFASGSEVEIALNAAELLTNEGIKCSVMSVPCFELVSEELKGKMNQFGVKVVVEAASKFGWSELVSNAKFVCMKGFGMSAPGSELYKYFGISADKVKDICLESYRNV